MKLAADRPQDEVDVQKLLETPELDDRETLRLVEKHLGLFAAGRLDKLARAAGRKDAPPDDPRHPS